MPGLLDPSSAPRRPEWKFSTDAVRPGQRLAYWKDAICSAFVRLDLQCDPRAPFHAELRARPWPRFDCIAVGGSPQRVARDERLLDEDHAESLIVMRQRSGRCIARQDGVETPIGPGELTLVDSRRPYALDFPEPFSQTVFRVPASLLEQRVGRGAVRAWRGACGASPLARLAREALDALGQEARESVALPLSSIAFDLLGLALADGQPDAAEPARLATLRVSWAKAYVLDNLRDPALGPRAVARRQGVSPRLLQRLFAAEGTSLGAFIVEERLLRCRAALEDPLQARRSITEIALSWGYNDPAHFATLFRRRFGCTPSDVRAGRSTRS
jgi:AraC-like DNA-binding protein